MDYTHHVLKGCMLNKRRATCSCVYGFFMLFKARSFLLSIWTGKALPFQVRAQPLGG